MTRPPAAAPPDDTAIDRRTRAGLILYTVSALLLITGVFMISGVVVAWIYDEAETMSGFVAAVVITLLIGVSGFLAFRRHRDASLLTRVFTFLATMDTVQLTKLLDEGAFSGPTRLAPIADAIRSRSTRRRRGHYEFAQPVSDTAIADRSKLTH